MPLGPGQMILALPVGPAQNAIHPLRKMQQCPLNTKKPRRKSTGFGAFYALKNVKIGLSHRPLKGPFNDPLFGGWIVGFGEIPFGHIVITLHPISGSLGGCWGRHNTLLAGLPAFGGGQTMVGIQL